MTYADAIEELYRGPHATFVVERKRLVGLFKGAGDKAGAAKLGKAPRPPISAWAVNQLWWHARAAFQALLETGEQLRAGSLAAMGPHREAIATLRAKASQILKDEGNAAAESTLRRVTSTLTAIAAGGGFDPEPPGALAADRDPPGFEAIGIASEPAEHEVVDADHDIARARAKKQAKAAAADTAADNDADVDPAPAESAAAKRALADAAEAAAERRKRELERARRATERDRVEAVIRTAQTDVERRDRELDRLADALAAAETAAETARAIVHDLESQLASLADPD